MNNTERTRRHWRVVPIIFAGILLFLLTLDLSGRNGLSRTQALTDNTLDTLRLQCISFHKLESADGTKSLFRLADSVQALSRHLELDPTLASNAYLEDFVDEIRLSGIALRLHPSVRGHALAGRRILRPAGESHWLRQDLHPACGEGRRLL